MNGNDPTTLAGVFAVLLVVLKLIGILDRWAHALGMAKVFESQLRHIAALNPKFAPVANAVADAVARGDDEQVIAKVEDVAANVQGATSIGDVVKIAIGEKAQPPFVTSPVSHGPQP